MNSDDFTYPARVTVVAMNGLNTHNCQMAAGWTGRGQLSPWGEYIQERCMTAGEFSRDVAVIVIHPRHDGDEFLGELLMTMARGDTERFVQLCQEKGWVDA